MDHAANDALWDSINSSSLSQIISELQNALHDPFVVSRFGAHIAETSVIAAVDVCDQHFCRFVVVDA